MRQGTTSLPRIVVDVSVAIWGSHPSGDKATDATYTPEDVCLICHQALEIIHGRGYRLAMTIELNEEWSSVLYKRRVVLNSPSSPRQVSALEYACEQYARTWFGKMTSTSRVDIHDAIEDGTRLPVSYLSEEQRKDAHLVESALSSDRRIVSHDKKVRAHWVELLEGPQGRNLVRSFSLLPRIVWVDPELHQEELCWWLENDAPDEPSFRLDGGASDLR